MTDYCEISGSPIKEDVGTLSTLNMELLDSFNKCLEENKTLEAENAELKSKLKEFNKILASNSLVLENETLKAALLEVTGNYAVQGKKLELAIEALISSRQFCTWLCEDSKKYQGTDAAHAARSKQIEIGKCLEKLK